MYKSYNNLTPGVQITQQSHPWCEEFGDRIVMLGQVGEVGTGGVHHVSIRVPVAGMLLVLVDVQVRHHATYAGHRRVHHLT